jgi:Xaa-Pro aminopeptidase
LELDEPPFLAPGMTRPLAAGMVVAVEPKVALPGVGVVGLEDTVVIGEGGAEYLTTAEREWIVLE